jgi:hypothetical protein
MQREAPERGILLTIWLFMIIVLNAISGLLSFLAILFPLERTTGWMSYAVSMTLVGLVSVIGAWLILRWKRSGLWLFILATLVGLAVMIWRTVMNLLSGVPWLSLAIGVVSLLVLLILLRPRLDDLH